MSVFFKVRIFIVRQPGSPIPIYTEVRKYIEVAVRVQFNKLLSFYEAPFYYFLCFLISENPFFDIRKIPFLNTKNRFKIESHFLLSKFYSIFFIKKLIVNSYVYMYIKKSIFLYIKRYQEMARKVLKQNSRFF